MNVKNRPKAFTLVGLLVVLAIIGILAGLLMPALGAARRAARRHKAGADIQNIGIAVTQYTADFGYPPPDTMVDPWPANANDGYDILKDVGNPFDLNSDLNNTGYADHHPCTPNECLVYYLGTKFDPNIAYNSADNTDQEGRALVRSSDYTETPLFGFTSANSYHPDYPDAVNVHNTPRKRAAYGGAGVPDLKEIRGPYYDFSEGLVALACIATDANGNQITIADPFPPPETPPGTTIALWKGGRPFFSFIDPWGLPYFYNAAGGAYGDPKHGDRYDFFSVGPNGKTAQSRIDIQEGAIGRKDDGPWATYTVGGVTYEGQIDLFVRVLANPASGNDVDTAKGGTPGSAEDADDVNNW